MEIWKGICVTGLSTLAYIYGSKVAKQSIYFGARGYIFLKNLLHTDKSLSEDIYIKNINQHNDYNTYEIDGKIYITFDEVPLQLSNNETKDTIETIIPVGRGRNPAIYIRRTTGLHEVSPPSVLPTPTNTEEVSPPTLNISDIDIQRLFRIIEKCAGYSGDFHGKPITFRHLVYVEPDLASILNQLDRIIVNTEFMQEYLIYKE